MQATQVDGGASARATPSRAPGPELEGHLLGSHTSGLPGPLFLAVGGIHGNEPAGVHAIRAVLARLQEERIELRGRLVGLAGNLEALRADVRFLSRDLNRMWATREVSALPSSAPAGAESPEELARRRLLAHIEAEIARPRQGPVVVLDLHSTSASGAPFSVMGDTLQNRRIAFALPAPVILGLEEEVDGALLEYFGERGHVAVGFEGGQHRDPRTVLHHEAALWLALMAAGSLAPERHRELEAGMRARLAEATVGLPAVVEIRHRQAIEAGDGFRMQPGFENFARVEAGALLASDRAGEIRAPRAGRVLLPLYQGLGQEGFFLGREVRPFWLGLSAWLRRLSLERFLRLLPGVAAHPTRADSLLVDARVARLWPVEIFHLLGYRRRRVDGDRLVFTRRVEGSRPRELLG